MTVQVNSIKQEFLPPPVKSQLVCLVLRDKKR